MPGGDLATTWPERMLYGILPDENTRDLLKIRGWNDQDIAILEKQVERKLNTAVTTSTGRILDAASALLGICKRKTYDGEPAMRLESVAHGITPELWDIPILQAGNQQVLDTAELLRISRDLYLKNPSDTDVIKKIAASIQYNLARGIAVIACNAAHDSGISTIALSGGVAYNEMIRETIRKTIHNEGLHLHMNLDMPFGDGCISFGQCVFAGKKENL